jgi:hypothetical protein
VTAFGGVFPAAISMALALAVFMIRVVAPKRWYRSSQAVLVTLVAISVIINFSFCVVDFEAYRKLTYADKVKHCALHYVEVMCHYC